MKRLIICCAILLPAVLQAQLIDKLKKKIKNKTEERIEKKVDQSVDKAFDKAEDAATKNSKKDSTVVPVVNKSETTAAVNTTPALTSYSKFDFIPGEVPIYTENFDQEAIGELPNGWNTSGTGEVVTLNSFPGKWLRLYQNTAYLANAQQDFGENYTVEFDVIMQLKDNGHFFPYFSFALYGSNGQPSGGNDFLKEYKKYTALETTVYPALINNTKILFTSFDQGRFYYRGDSKGYGKMQQSFNKPAHIAVQVQKERFRMWINEDKVFDVPKAAVAGKLINQLYFRIDVSSYKEDEYGMFISNIKVAKGVPDNRHKLVDEGRFSTSGILFDVNTAVIKPESYGVIREIAAVLNEYKDIRVKVVGHTDSDGSDAANLQLSQERAQAVAKALTTDFGIDGSRLETDGKGEQQPVADNKTKEGKAANRRVEFIKL